MAKQSTTDSPTRLRTMLANERTLLAYVRTSIMLAFSGITAIKIFPEDRFFLAMGIMLVPVAAGVGLLGYMHFRRVRDRTAG